VPLCQSGLGAGAEGPAESREQEVVGHGMTLSPFGGMLLEQGVKAEVLGHPPEGRHGAEVADECGVRAIGLLEASEQVVGFAEMGQDDGSGFAVEPSALHDLPVGMTADRLGHEARHEISVYGHRNESSGYAEFAENIGKSVGSTAGEPSRNLVYTIC